MPVIDSLRNVWTPLNGSRMRSISSLVCTGQLEFASLSNECIERWSDGIGEQGTAEPGDILAIRGQGLIPAYLGGQVRSWLDGLGMSPRGLDANTLACRGAFFHHDAEYFSGSIFAVVWLDDQDNSDLLLPVSGRRIELKYGTVILFDPCQPHGVVLRGKDKFNEADFYGNDIAAFACFDIDAQDDIFAKSMSIRLRDGYPNEDENCILIGEFQEPRKDKVDKHTGQWILENSPVGFSNQYAYGANKKEEILA